MAPIRTFKNPWRDRYQQARFRDAIFHVETGGQAGGRRVALHEYPKRNVPYAEDMGKRANIYSVQGYLIGPSYLTLKDALITALEKDGPGLLRLPMPYMMRDVKVMVQSYSVTEARERGGMCAIEMQFVEYGDPNYRSTVSTPQEIQKSASNVENSVLGEGQPDAETAQQASPYAQVYRGADVSNSVPSLP